MNAIAKTPETPVKQTHGVYHRDREYARESGDPLLGTVDATSLDEALDLAYRKGISSPAGLWVWLLPKQG